MAALGDGRVTAAAMAVAPAMVAKEQAMVPAVAVVSAVATKETAPELVLIVVALVALGLTARALVELAMVAPVHALAASFTVRWAISRWPADCVWAPFEPTCRAA